MTFEPKDALSPEGLKIAHEVISEEIESVFGNAVEELKKKKIDAIYSYNINRDGSIDAELRIRTLPRFKSISQVFTLLEESIKPIDGTWVSSGVLFAQRSDDAPYDKQQGYNKANTYYQPARKYHFNLATARQIVTNLRRGNRGGAKQIFYRVFWNAMGEKPGRER